MTDDRLFLHENLSSPENRINVALFGLMTVPEVRHWLLDRLGLPRSGVVFPPKNLEHESRRPDFQVVDATSEETLAWIEVEIVSDSGQLEGYRQVCAPVPVFGVWGRREYDGDLSLEELAKHLNALLEGSLDAQIGFNLRHLLGQISEALEGRTGRSYKRAPVSKRMLETRFLSDLQSKLSDLVTLDVSQSMSPGRVRIDTNMENGFSIRVFSRVAKAKSLSIASRTGGTPFVWFQALSKLNRYLPSKAEALSRLARLVSDMGGDMVGIGEKSKTSVPLETAERNVDALASVIRQLAKV